MRRLALLALILALDTACFEGFGALETTVRLDTEAQVFHVERRLENVSSAFLGCGDPEGCREVVQRLRAFAPLPTGGPAERLMQRILDSGAQGLALEVRVDGERVDAVLRYDAPLGSVAADDTMFHAEWDGKGERGDYLLTIDAQPSFSPPDKYQVRRVARAGPAGPEWGESWVLPKRTTSGSTRMAVDPGARALLGEYPDLADAFGGEPPAVPPAPAPVVAIAPAPVPAPPAPATVRPAPAAVAPPSPAPAPPPSPAPAPAPAPPPSPSPSPSPAPPPSPAPAAAPPASSRAWAPPDPLSPARTYVFDVVVSGGALSPAAAVQASARLHPRFARCYQDRWAAAPEVQGNAFVSARVRPDAFVETTSVFGQLQDRPLLTCLEAAIEDWAFPPFPGDAPSEVTIPLTFRVEEPPKGRRGR